ncbi:MAG: invasion protein [Microvirga sp.]|nr:invasion protein [Microvirga sp.]
MIPAPRTNAKDKRKAMSSATRPVRLRGPICFMVAASVAAVLATPSAVVAQDQPAPGQQRQRPAPRSAQPARQSAPAPQAPPAVPGAAQGQQQGPTVVQVKAEPSQPDWTKVCGKDPASNAEICYTTRDFVSDQGHPVMAVAVYEQKGSQQTQRVVRFLLPLQLMLQPGIRFAVDQGQPTPGRYALCFPNGCFAEAIRLKDDLIAAMKKGTNLNVSVQNAAAREVTFAVPLAGFGKAFDGPAIDPKVLEEQQKKLQEELEKRSDELRKRLQSSSGSGTTTAAAPSPPAAPTPATASNPSHGDATALAIPSAGPPSPTAPVQPPMLMKQMTVSALTDKNLEGATGNDIGDIEHVVESVGDKKQYVVVTSGGLLGLFETARAIPLENVTVQGDHVLLRNMNDDQLKSLPNYDNSGNAYRELDSEQTVTLSEGK